jgi:transposase
MAEKRRRYTKEFKDDAVQYLINHPEKSITDAAANLGVKRDLLSRWKKERELHGKQSFPGNGNIQDDDELIKLRRKLADSQEENEILKKALAIFSKGQK